jgi:hypothetical protein
LRVFPAANEISAIENIDQSKRKEFEEDFRKHFKEANKKLIIIKVSEKLLKTISEYTENAD